MSIIETVGVKKVYSNKEIFKGIDLKIPLNKISLIMGPSGAGKTTLLNLFAFMEEADSGDYYWKGINTKDISKSEKRRIRRDSMSFIFQDFNVFEELTVKENLEVFLKHTTSINKKEWDSIITNALKNFEIMDIVNSQAKFLSGGERQRLAIARSFIKDTEILFADEPSANIDEDNKKMILKYFKAYKQEGRTVVIVSHDNSYIDFADKVFRFENSIIKCEK